MKKYLFIIMSALVLANGALFAQNTAQSETKTEDAAEGTVKEKSGTWPSFMTTKDADVRTGFAKERLVEIGIANVNFGFSNSWFKIGDLADFVLSIFSGGKSYDIEDFLNKGAMAVEFGTDSKPLYARVKIGSLFTLDLATRFESAIQANVTQEAIDTLKKLNDAKKNPSGLTPSDLDKLGGDVYLAGNTYASLDIGLEKTFLNRGGAALDLSDDEVHSLF